MTQPDLFTHHPRARRRDPSTSHLAALEVTESGRASEQAAVVLDVVSRYPGLCSVEMTGYCDLERHQIARRLPELERDGLVRKGAPRTPLGGRPGVTWYPA